MQAVCAARDPPPPGVAGITVEDVLRLPCLRPLSSTCPQVIPMLSGDATEQTPPDLPSFLFKERIVYLVRSAVRGAAIREVLLLDATACQTMCLLDG